MLHPPSEHLHDLNCNNHPQRAAVERCEVCGKPLCNFCLYYTDDGQRLCEEHALDAQSQGLGFHPPEEYSDGLISAQARASENLDANVQHFGPPKGALSGPLILYRANNNDLLGFVGMLAGVMGLLTLCGAGICIPVAGAFLSIAALVNAGDAVDRKRTRLQAIIGLSASGALLIGLIVMFAFCFWSFRVSSNLNLNNNTATTPIPTTTPLPTRTRAPIATSTPDELPSIYVPGQADVSFVAGQAVN